MTPQPAIITEGLQKVYRSGFFRRPFTGLEVLDLQVEQGEVFGFIGPNGAGKTTAIKCLVGLHLPTAGSAHILGLPTSDPESRRAVGFLPERPYFYQHLTAWEFLDFYGRLFDLPSATRAERANNLLERLQLSRFAHVPLRQYSKGMQQRAGLAQALMNDPDLLILDEPMSGLDPVGRMLVRDIILEERRAGKAVFFSSHILSDVQSICDRVGLIVEGRLRAVGRVHDLLASQVAHVDCTVVVPGDLVLPGVEVARQEDERIIRVPAEEVDPLLSQIIGSGGRIIQVQPARRNLEDLLVDEMGRTPSRNRTMGVLA